MEPAPFLADVADGPDGGQAYWLHTRDGTRIRLGIWPEREKGTVLLFPGRTEYIEKYGRVATEFAARGYGMIAIDWRGQGLADRPLPRRDMGHVESFDAYRQDVEAVRTALRDLDVKEPHFLLGHSMGGAIGLRALYDGLPVVAAVFSAPMWGIRMTGFPKAVSGLLMRLSGPLGLGKRFAPTTGPAAPMPFVDNPLTHDRDQFEYMENQVARYPDLALGGPSITWVHAAIVECNDLRTAAPLNLPILTLLGSEEQIVDMDAVAERMANWPGGQFDIVEGARHELLMERPDLRMRCIGQFADWFDNHDAAALRRSG